MVYGLDIVVTDRQPVDDARLAELQRRAAQFAAFNSHPDALWLANQVEVLAAELSRLRAEHNPDALEPGDPWDNPGRNPHRCKSWSGCVGVSEQCASYRNHDGPHSWAVAALVPVQHPEGDQR